MGADKVVVLSDGKVAEAGKPAELLERDGLFRQMVRLQSESQNWILQRNGGTKDTGASPPDRRFA